MSLHSVETFDTVDGKIGWRVKVGDDVVASDARQGYNNKEDALEAFFGIFFGTWDESFLSLYQMWQSYAGASVPELPPEAEAGPPVHIQPSKATAEARVPEVSVENPPKREDN